MNSRLARGKSRGNTGAATAKSRLNGTNTFLPLKRRALTRLAAIQPPAGGEVNDRVRHDGFPIRRPASDQVRADRAVRAPVSWFVERGLSPSSPSQLPAKMLYTSWGETCTPAFTVEERR